MALTGTTKPNLQLKNIMSNRIDSASGNFREGLNNNSWMVCDPDGTPFWELPQPCNERTAMAAIRLARHCAKEEFARGKKMGGDAMLAANPDPGRA